jgi:DNA-binding NtrC family response regulator
MGSCMSAEALQVEPYTIEIKNNVEQQNFKNITHAFEYIDQLIIKEEKICDKYLNKNIIMKDLSHNQVINILYLEDNEIYYVLMKYILEQNISHSINMVMKTTIPDAYDYIQTNHVDLIFLDRVLENGFLGDELYYKLLDEKYDVSKIIFISSVDSLADIDRYEQCGIKYFTKPLKIDKFVQFINTFTIIK